MASYLDMELLRFTTAGSVDDGKSTLIGRLLYDSKSIFEDQLEAVKAASERMGNKEFNLALLTDGLRAEREQGITIDVAYRYFATPKRKFIIADTPGHIEYTRNMVTGASTADAAIILVDARNGIVEQTRRHSCIASLLRLPDVVVAINKMDLVNFSQEIFEQIRAEYGEVARKLGLKRVYYIPISARDGDNVVNPSERMPWFKDKPLLELLEELPVGGEGRAAAGRFPVQYVIRPQKDEYHDYRAYAGRIAGGHFKVGDPIIVLPSGSTSVIAGIEEMGVELECAWAPESVAIRLKDNIDISRGDMIVKSDELPLVSNEVSLLICWLNHRPLHVGSKYIIRHTTNELIGIVKEIQSKIDVNTLDEVSGDMEVRMNDIARILLKTAKPLKYDPYAENRTTGSLVLIDEATFETVGAGMII
ncbi:MAG: GTP-binding protein [Tannerellaceae bacterium]|jgi:sulfate adenylyltransferase subunit 1|nr:GTP-binding protein [Tannerellaceae bacterium]